MRRHSARPWSEETMPPLSPNKSDAGASVIQERSATTGRSMGIPLSGTIERVGRYRWTICALLFFATTINYVDRQVLGILAPTLQRELGWSETQYRAIVSWFT